MHCFMVLQETVELQIHTVIQWMFILYGCKYILVGNKW